MRSVLTIGRLVCLESLRGQILYAMLVFLAVYLGFCVYISTLSLGGVARIIQDSGMLGLTLIGLAGTILFGLYALYQERERNELYVLLSRIPRSAYLLGRFLGAGAILALCVLLMGSGIFVLTWLIGRVVAPALFLAVCMTMLESGLLMAIGFLFYAMGLSFTLNAFLVLGMFVVGHSFDEAIESFIALGEFGSPLHLKLVRLLSYVLPNFDMFDFRLAIVHHLDIPVWQPLMATLYGLSYLAAVLGLAVMVMNRKDI